MKCLSWGNMFICGNIREQFMELGNQCNALVVANGSAVDPSLDLGDRTGRVCEIVLIALDLGACFSLYGAHEGLMYQGKVNLP